MYGWLPQDDENPRPWSSELCARLSIELEPLSGFLSSVERVFLWLWDVSSPHSLAVLSRLFGNVQCLELVSGFNEDIAQVVRAVVEGMPSLKSVCLRADSEGGAEQLPSILLSCVQASRPLSLDLHSDSAYTRSELRKVSREWLRMAKDLGGAEDVEMTVHGYDSDLES